MNAGTYIYKKEVDWSLLHQGLTIPVSLQVVFKEIIKHSLPRGTTKNVNLILDGKSYPAKLTNQKFNEIKYQNHNDIIQIRYDPKNDIAQKLRLIFSEQYNYMLEARELDNNSTYRKRPVVIPEEMKQYVILYTTDFEDTFLIDYITSNESIQIRKSLPKISEEEFELNSNYVQFDLTATIKEKKQLVKIRKLDRSICDNLKLLYENRCQITGERYGEYYSTNIIEAHHIDYFTKSLNNNSGNIIIISPNFHRIIHKTNPVFDRKRLAFIFPNGVVEKIKLNLHL